MISFPIFVCVGRIFTLFLPANVALAQSPSVICEAMQSSVGGVTQGTVPEFDQ